MRRLVRVAIVVVALAVPLTLIACSNANVYVGVGVVGPWGGPYGGYPYPMHGGWGRPY